MRLIPKAPIHIGAGSNGTFKTMVLMRKDGVRVPIIPAESLKGALRSIATRIAKSSSYSRVLWNYFDVDEIVKSHRKDRHEDFVKNLQVKLSEELGDEHLRKILEATGLFSSMYIEAMIKELAYTEVLEILSSIVCPICRLFGSRHVAGKLLIEDAILEGDPRKFKIETRTHVSISRTTRTCEEGRLFVVEFLSPEGDVKFKTKIIADNIERGEMDAKLLAALLTFLKEKGLTLGGCKSRGFGSFDVEVEIYKMNLERPLSKDDVMTIMRNVDALLMRNVSKIAPEELAMR
ncbi:MAG: RAMP superfamily CRISPR-associated protein [Candidatus Nezhaarchaeales archaeon]